MAAEQGFFFTFTGILRARKDFSLHLLLSLYGLLHLVFLGLLLRRSGEGGRQDCETLLLLLQWTSSNQVQDSLTSKGVSFLSFF